MATQLSPAMRRRLDIQGLEEVEDEWLVEVKPWLSMAFYGCVLLAGLGTALASTEILWGLVAITVLGTVSRVHPVDLIYNHGIRRLTGTRPLPERRAPTRFACAVGTVWLIVVILLFWGGYSVAAYALGALLAAVALLVATTGICIPSIIWRALLRNAPAPRAD